MGDRDAEVQSEILQRAFNTLGFQLNAHLIEVSERYENDRRNQVEELIADYEGKLLKKEEIISSLQNLLEKERCNITRTDYISLYTVSH